MQQSTYSTQGGSTSLTSKILQGITEEQILDILKQNSLLPVKIQKTTIWFPTRCHEGDSNKLCFFRETKDFYCYTNCGRMNFIQLLSQIRNCSYREASTYVANLLNLQMQRRGVGTETHNMRLLLELESTMSFRKARNQRKSIKECSLSPIPSIEKSPLNFFEKNVFYEGWFNEGISVTTMQKFDIRWYEARKHIIIPHVNFNGELVGIRRRTLIPQEEEHGKYMPETFEKITYAHSLGLNLYGLYHNKEAIQKYHTAIIVEGEKSVLLSDTFFGEQSVAVATCGFNISNWQRDVLLKLGAKTVYLAFDKDFDPSLYVDKSGLLLRPEDSDTRKYIRYVQKIESLASKFFGFATVKVIWDEPNTEAFKGVLEGGHHFSFLNNDQIYSAASDYSHNNETKAETSSLSSGVLQQKDSPFDRGKDNLLYLLQNAITISQREQT